MSKQQTAVEWIFDNLLEEGPSGELRWHLRYDIFKVFEQAKAMEREQLFKVWNYLSEQGWGTTEKENREDFEKWFSKTA